MGLGEGQGAGCGQARGKTERVAVPAMPMPMAIICCILNFLIPGLGTIVAGFSTFCCARNEDMSATARIGACCVSFSIGLLQLITMALLLLGWIWSCVWGVFFIGMSTEYYHDNPPNTGTTVRPSQPAQSAVVVQPGAYYPQYPQGQSLPQGSYQQPGAYPQGPTAQVPYGANVPQPPLYSPSGSNNPYGEPPPPYEAAPSAPPMEK